MDSSRSLAIFAWSIAGLFVIVGIFAMWPVNRGSRPEFDTQYAFGDRTIVSPIQTPSPIAASPEIGKTKAISNIRSGPSLDSELLTSVGLGTELELVCYEGIVAKWYKLAAGGWIWHTQLESQPVQLPNCSGQEPSGKSVVLAPDTPTSPKPTLTNTPASKSTLRPTPTGTPTPAKQRNCSGGCTTYPTWCEPPVKGNVSYRTGEKIYHVPGGEFYDETVIDTRYGERWFCTETEARAAGWRKAGNGTTASVRGTDYTSDFYDQIHAEEMRVQELLWAEHAEFEAQQAHMDELYYDDRSYYYEEEFDEVYEPAGDRCYEFRRD